MLCSTQYAAAFATKRPLTPCCGVTPNAVQTGSLLGGAPWSTAQGSRRQAAYRYLLMVTACVVAWAIIKSDSTHGGTGGMTHGVELCYWPRIGSVTQLPSVSALLNGVPTEANRFSYCRAGGTTTVTIETKLSARFGGATAGQSYA
jgi:hypothetical protein